MEIAMDGTLAMSQDGLEKTGRDLVWPAVLRKLERVSPGYDR